MVASVYTRLQATAERLIGKYGRSATLQREIKTGSAHDPVITYEDHSVTYVETGYKITDRSNSVIEAGDKVGLISTDSEVEPRKTDRLLIDGETWVMKDVQPLNPGGLLLLTEFVAAR